MSQNPSFGCISELPHITISRSKCVFSHYKGFGGKIAFTLFHAEWAGQQLRINIIIYKYLKVSV